MIVEIHDRVLCSDRWYPVLDALVTVLQQPGNRHAFDAIEVGKLVKSPWLKDAKGSRASLPSLLRDITKSVARTEMSDAVILLVDDLAPRGGETLDPNTIRVDPLSALVVLLQPLHIIVEDETSDGGFILWMSRLLGLDVIHQAYRTGRLLFRHAGGKGQLKKSARALSFGVWPRSEPILDRKFRAIAVLDSDAKYPGHSPNSQYAENTTPYVSFVRVLRGRSIESYVPPYYAKKWADNHNLSAGMESFSRLSEVQRNHFPLKVGFRQDSYPNNPIDHHSFMNDEAFDIEERRIYRDIDPDRWAEFAGGFGGRLSEVFQDDNYRCEPGSYQQRNFPAAHRDELLSLLHEVIRYL